MGRGSSGKQSGKGKSPKRPPPPYTTDADGVRNYPVGDESGKAFYALSDNAVYWNKGADVFKKLPDGKTMQATVKRAQMWDFLNNNNFNEFIFHINGYSAYPEKALQRIWKQLADHGYLSRCGALRQRRGVLRFSKILQAFDAGFRDGNRLQTGRKGLMQSAFEGVTAYGQR